MNNKQNKPYLIGLDIGSTTIKTVVIDSDKFNILHSSYERHFSDIKSALYRVLSVVIEKYSSFGIMVTGSGGLSASEWLGIPFIQEVVAGVKAVETYLPSCDVAIELGGEDAKITYFKNGLEQRMNGTCAGGTGAFIDQMATLLATDATGLNELAKDCKIIYPIASRCGVFAKSDVQPLINDGAKKSDIAGSIFQSVVNQTISGLACGKPIKGRVAFLGGPLHFLSELRNRFIQSINPTESYAPENSQVFNAIGSALSSIEGNVFFAKDLKEKLESLNKKEEKGIDRLPALFETKEEKDEFYKRHNSHNIIFSDISNHVGEVFLGIDAGSTTTKIVCIDGEGKILYNWYGANGGDPLQTIQGILKEIYDKMPNTAFIAKSTVTGYGENLIKSALGIDDGEIETMAHQTASNFILPGVEFILDIGGQDMKCMRIKDGIINDILLNEACSSGCGSFIETFATALSIDVKDFAKKGLDSKKPVDLGSRCTVFMNSCVKQAQKEGASVADISAGLAYSVVKNALFKVIKLRDSSTMGKKIIVQGGTFLNDSILRAFELISGREVVRPSIAGLMGAYGCALIAKNKYVKVEKTNTISKDSLKDFESQKTTARCKKCGNNCLLTITDFGSGKRFVTNNRCERGAEGIVPQENKIKLPNMYEYKYKRLFEYYKPLELEKAKRGRVGIPRVLNIYENYPFWFTFFSHLGFRVELSPNSNRAIYDMGIETIPSDTVCYPAKISHGHLVSLVKQGHKFIFFPCIPYELQENPNTDNHYNCPVVATYAELLRNNAQQYLTDDIKYMCPFLPYNNPNRLTERLIEEFPEIDKKEIREAVKLGFKEDEKFKNDIKNEAQRILSQLGANDRAIILAGRPYHLDHEINHGIPEMINSFGFAILTEDSISHIGKIPHKLRVYDQWMYHSRLYNAAHYSKTRDNIDLIQLNSFGCGLDAITTDQVSELLKDTNKIYTTLKIDEVNNLGAAKIRVRSLIAVLDERRKKNIKANKNYVVKSYKNIFTKEMGREYTILGPEISPIHTTMLVSAFKCFGYNLEVVKESATAVDAGLKYVNNDACYPTILTVGSLIDAVLSGKYNINKTALLLAQTGGGCRATNYIPMLKKALSDMNLSHIPVLSLNFVGLEKQPGFKISISFTLAFVRSIILGDLLMMMLYATRPYEKIKGETQDLYNKWKDICKKSLEIGDNKAFASNIKNMVKEFANIQINDVKKPKVGLVGEILVKFHPKANNRIIEFLESEGAEAVMPGFMDFYMYCFYNNVIKHKLLDGKYTAKVMANLKVNIIEKFRKPMHEALKGTRFAPPLNIRELAKKAEKIVSLGNISGEGWFLTAEMLELLESGVENIVCMQPFACLPNHVTGKGVIKAVKQAHKNANIVAIDYDPGASAVNQINRIKLMLSVAYKNMKKTDTSCNNDDTNINENDLISNPNFNNIDEKELLQAIACGCHDECCDGNDNHCQK